MAEYYKYVDRKGENKVDWGTIGKDMSSGLKQVFEDRENKRQELDDVNQSLMTAANEVDMGQNKTFNQFVLDGSAQTKDFLLMQNKLLKKGLLNPNDYSRAMQTVKDDWASFSTATKNFNEVYKAAFDRLNDGTMSAEEAFKKEELFQFGNVQNKGIFVNPVDGRLYLAEKDKNGKLITDPSKLVSVASINNISNEIINKFDVVGTVAKGAEKMATIIRSIRKGNTLSIEDARKNDLYKKAKEDYIESMLTNPKQAVSVLGDYLGGYKFTYDQSEAGGDLIYLKKDGDGVGQGQLTPDQMKTAREALDAAFEAQIESKETPMPVYAPQKAAAGGKEEAGIVSNLAKVYYGDTNDVRSALSFFQGLRRDLVDIKRTADALILTNKDGQVIPIAFKDEAGNTLTQQQFIEAAINQLTPGGVKDLNKAMKDSGVDLTREFNPNGTADFKVGTNATQKPLAQTPILGPDGEIGTATSFLNAIDPDADNVGEVQEIISKVDPRITVKAQSNSWSKDKLEIYIDGNLFKTINYDDKVDKATLTQTVEEARNTLNGTQKPKPY